MDLELPSDDAELFNFIHKVDSTEIVYSQPEIKYRLIGPYIKGDVLGEGSYGKVKECIHSRTLQRCAVKIMKHKVLRRIPNGEQNVRREILLLQGLQHKNIIQLIDVMHSSLKQKIYMVMDYCVAVLQEMLDSAPQKRFPVWQAHRYFLQLMSGVEYIHSKGVIHKDIKPGNLLLTTNSTLKIIDFGVAEKINTLAKDDMITTSQGSPVFQPPEVAKGVEKFSGFKVDVWSSGVTLYNMCSGDYPYDGPNVFRLYENICEKDVNIPKELDHSLQSLLNEMLTKDPHSRISVRDVQKHEWCLRKHLPNHEAAIPLVCKKDGRKGFTAIDAVRCHFYEGDDQVHPNQLFITEGHYHPTDDDLPLTGRDNKIKTKKSKAASCINFKSLSSCTQS